MSYNLFNDDVAITFFSSEMFPQNTDYKLVIHWILIQVFMFFKDILNIIFITGH
jgi:hypothetical protein